MTDHVSRHDLFRATAVPFDVLGRRFWTREEFQPPAPVIGSIVDATHEIVLTHDSDDPIRVVQNCAPASSCR